MMKYVMYGKGIVWKAMVRLLEYMKYDFVWMDDVDKDDNVLDKADKVIVSAWISPKHDMYQKYSNKLMGELDLCYQILEEYKILDYVHFYCITGTNGKSTTTWVAYNVLQQLLEKTSDDDKVMICGNFEPAVSEVVLDIITHQKEDSVNKHYHLVTEISSFMCYQINKFHSDYSIITNLAPDHLNRHSDLTDYYGSKIRLFECTKNSCITNDEVIEYIGDRASNIVSYSAKSIDLAKTKFIGKHNAENFAAVYYLVEQIAKENHIDRNDKVFYECIQDIEPLGNRCRKSLIVDWIQFIDDLHATGTHSQSAALSCVEGELILICWWKEAGENYSVMLEKYRNKVKAAVIIGKESLPFSPIFNELGTPYFHTMDMKTGLLMSIAYAKEYNLKTILYSPGAKSFDLFKNWEDRAHTFLTELTKLTMK